MQEIHTRLQHQILQRAQGWGICEFMKVNKKFKQKLKPIFHLI